MNAVRNGFIWSAALLVGCGSSQPQPNETVKPAGGQDDLLAGIVTARPAETPATLEEKRTKLASHLALAQEFAERGELDRAIQLLEEAVRLDAKHRTVLLLLMQYSQARSKAVEAEDQARAYRLMVQSGGYLRMLRDAHRDFSMEERAVIANVLFDEACAHARSKRQEETSGSLAAAIEAGFDDLQRLKSEPDFEEFRKVPAMAKMLAEAEGKLELRARE